MDMICEYEYDMQARCPADERTVDYYTVRVVSSTMIECGELRKILGELHGVTMWQEDITKLLATRLRCKVMTLGYHHGIKTTITAES